MPVEKTDVIDLITRDSKTGEIALIMVETRNWSTTPEAVMQLDGKMSAYAEFLLSGALAKQHPDLAKCPVRIQLDHLSPITEAVAEELRKWAGRFSSIHVTVWTCKASLNPFRFIFKKLFAKPGEEKIQWKGDLNPNRELLSAGQFSEEFIEFLRKKLPEHKIERVSELELCLTASNGKSMTAYLTNAYNQFQFAPEEKVEIMQKYGESIVETINFKDTIAPGQIIPILKDKAWLADISRNAQQGKPLIPVSEPYNQDLILVYAEDTPHNIRYLTVDNLPDLNLKQQDLKRIACENLKRLYPNPKIESFNGVYKVSIGGDYDASLILIPEALTGLEIDGDLVAAIPSRDVVLLTGSNNQAGLKTLRTTAKSIFSRAAYRLSQELYVYKDGAFAPLDT